MKQEAKRNATLDVLKGIAIILVIFAHCIQFGSGYEYLESESYFYNAAFKFIYSFHMPLFMLISGYLFYFSIQKHSFSYNLKTRFTSLLVPIIVWQTIWILLGVSNNHKDESTLFVFNSYLNTLWFITSVFINSLIVLYCHKVTKDSLLIYGVIFLISLLIPNYYGYNLYVFMYPYFLCAYLVNNIGNIKKALIKTYIKNKTILLFCLLVLFSILLSYYDINDYAYTSGTFIIRNHMLSLTQIKIDIFRWLIGLIGSLCVIISVDLICSKCQQSRIIKGLCFIGTKTMGLYIISTYLFKCLLLLPIKSFCYITIVLECVIITNLSYLIMWLIEQNKYTRKYLLGGR